MPYTVSKAEEQVFDLMDSLGTRSPYLDLAKRCILRTIFPDQNLDPDGNVLPYDAELRREGRLYPTEAYSMVGELRLDSLEKACLEVINNSVPGDFAECGVWRGGCGILMKAVLRDRRAEGSRRVWLFDSFEGAPPPRLPEDSGDRHFAYSHIFAVSKEAVEANFRAMNLLDGGVVFRQGWFSDTVPAAHDLQSIAVLRLDGDMYESTKVCLDWFYPRISKGGYVLIDDYYVLDGCRRAVDDYRSEHEITATILASDWNGVYWLKA